MEQFNHSEYITMFENLAKRHKVIKHDVTVARVKRVSFFRMNGGEEKRQASGVQINYPNLNLIPYYGKLREAGEVNRDMYGAFMVLEKVSDPTDFATIESKRDNCQEIAEQIIAQLHYMQEQTEQYKLLVFDVNSVKIDLVGPVHDLEYGVRASFMFGMPLYDINTYNEQEFFEAE